MFFSLISNSAKVRMRRLENMTFYLQRAFHAFKTHLTFHSTIATNGCSRQSRCHYYPYLTDKKTKAQRGQMPAGLCER